MSAVWTKVRGWETEKHNGPSPMLSAMIRIRFATSMDSIAVGDCGIYRRDPEKHSDAPNLLPDMVEKARRADMRKQIRSIMKGKR